MAIGLGEQLEFYFNLNPRTMSDDGTILVKKPLAPCQVEVVVTVSGLHDNGDDTEYPVSLTEAGEVQMVKIVNPTGDVMAEVVKLTARSEHPASCMSQQYLIRHTARLADTDTGTTRGNVQGIEIRDGNDLAFITFAPPLD